MKLVLFFTRGVSLRTWDNDGIFDREVAIYQMLQNKGINISFVTYGSSSDFDYMDRIPGINILCNRWKLPKFFYEFFLHRLHTSALRECNVIKTNQTNGADIALRSARYWHKPLIVRCGYMWSYFAAKNFGNDSGKARRARRVESRVFNTAQRVVVTTSSMKTDVCERIPGACSKTAVIPNYVDTKNFRQDNTNDRDIDVIFIGRFEHQKNIRALLEAVESLNVQTVLIGSGKLENQLKQRFSSFNNNLHWVRNMPHSELPDYINRAHLFILPSHYEGHPKVFIEAMSCGATVIGADAPGIREIINHGMNGWLCGTSPESIRAAILHLLNDPGLCSKLGNNARKYALEHFDLDRILKMEEKVLKSVMDENSIGRVK